MSALKQIRLGSAAKVISGYAFKSEHFVTEGVPVIKIGNIQNGAVLFDDGATEYLPQETADTVRSKFLVKAGDILISLTGSHMTQPNSVVGRVAQYKYPFTSILNQRAGKVVITDEEALNNDYLYYLLSTNGVRQEIALLAHGAANQANVSPKDIEKLKFNVLPKADQTKIVAILSSYDELIENNNRGVAVLEKLAAEIHREWFVRFRFPGHKKATFHKGLPSEWKINRIGKQFSTFLGGTPSRDEPSYWGGDIPWINSGEINKMRIVEESEFITESGLRYSATKRMPKRTTVIALTGATLGQVSLTEIEVCANQSVVGVHDRNGLFNEYIFQFVKANIANMIAKQSGGGQQHINKDIVEKEDILLPPEILVQKYNLIIRPIFDQIGNLLFSTKSLVKLRDLLLPRLIGGKLSVEDLDIQFPPGMTREAEKAA